MVCNLHVFNLISICLAYGKTTRCAKNKVAVTGLIGFLVVRLAHLSLIFFLYILVLGSTETKIQVVGFNFQPYGPYLGLSF